MTGHVVLMIVGCVGGLWWLASGSLPLGSYSGAIDTSDLFPAGFRQGAFEHLNQILFGIAILPFTLALGFVVEAVRGGSGPRGHAFAMWLVLVTPATVAIATNFDLRIAGGVQQRYAFYFAPLLLVAGACFVVIARRPLLVIAGSAAATVWVVTRSAYQPYVDGSIFASPTRPPWVALDYRVDQIAGWTGIGNGLALALATLAAAAVLAWLLHRGRRSLALALLGAGITIWCVAMTLYSAPKVRAEHESLAILGLVDKQPMAERSWIDAAVPDDARVALLPSPINARDGRAIPLGTVTDQAVWWEAEFWNRSVTRSYRYRASLDYTPFVSERIRLNRRTGRLHVSGGELPYLATATSDVRLAPAGRIVARGPDLDLYRPVRPYRAAWATRALTDNGELRGRAQIDVYGRHPRGSREYSVSVRLAEPSTAYVREVRAGGQGNGAPFFGRRTVRQRVCVAARGARKVRLWPGPPEKVRVVGIRVRMGRPC